MSIESLADLLARTIDALAQRAPAIVAAAAHELGAVVLALHFGDGSEAELRAQHSRLLVRAQPAAEAIVECSFDDHALNLLFDLQHRPVDEVWASSLDVRGPRAETLAVWRTFRLLAQRAAGLRAVQDIWRAYRDQQPGRWGQRPPAPVQHRNDGDGLAPPRGVAWRALDFLDQRYPSARDHAGGTLADTVQPVDRLLWDGHRSQPWWEPPAVFDADLQVTMQSCKRRVRAEIERIVPDREPRAELYDLMRDYPAREGKGLRPTLAIAACAALGGRPEDAVRAAAAIELFHNGFLVHDDISDESTHRRGLETLHTAHGIGLAVNTGDAMNLLAIDTVLSNLDTLGLARTLGLIHEIMHMCRETIEGQAIELGWIRRHVVPERDEDYFHMSTKKTGWYTCISPCRLGAICAGETGPALLDRFNEVFRLVGIAFQIQDDVLNLVGDEALYGKEPLGDLLEGKRTVMLIELFRRADGALRARLDELIRLTRAARTQRDAEELLAAMHHVGAIDYAIALANRLAHAGVRRFEQDLAVIPENEAKAVLRQIAHYVVTRPL